uniref:Avidin n=1 Tax=Gopherus evgoodei TaxID=1825980 RepID=A0A8C4YBV5_9SAUR
QRHGACPLSRTLAQPGPPLLSGTDTCSCLSRLLWLWGEGAGGKRMEDSSPIPWADRLASRLHGIQHGASPTEQPTFGFTVKWQFSDSMSVFVGQCFVDDQGEETLQTMWLLRQEVGSPGADWKATRWVTGHSSPPRQHPQGTESVPGKSPRVALLTHPGGVAG